MNRVMPETLARFRLQAANHIAGADQAVFERLQVDLNAAAVERRVGAVDADEARKALHRRVLQNHLGEILLAQGHGRERDGLRSFGDSQDHAGILHREEAFGDDPEEINGRGQSSRRDQQGHRLMAENHGQRLAVKADNALENALREAIDSALLVVRLVMQKARAHHWRKRQRHHRRDQDGHGQGDGELAEQAADDVAHEQQRNQHRDQRNGQRQNGKADLLGTFERGGHGSFTLFDVARDIFDHHDRVVHHEAGGNGERH